MVMHPAPLVVQVDIIEEQASFELMFADKSSHVKFLQTLFIQAQRLLIPVVTGVLKQILSP